MATMKPNLSKPTPQKGLNGVAGALVLLMRADLPKNVKLVLATLLSHADFRTVTRAYPTLATLSAEAGLSVARCRAALKEAVHLGIITKGSGTCGGDPKRGVTYDFDLRRMNELPLLETSRGKTLTPSGIEPPPPHNEQETPLQNGCSYIEDQDPDQDHKQKRGVSVTSNRVPDTTNTTAAHTVRVTTLIDAYAKGWEQLYDGRYQPRPHERRLFDDLATRLSVTEAAPVFEAWFRENTERVVTERHPVQWLFNNWDRLARRADDDARDERKRRRMEKAGAEIVEERAKERRRREAMTPEERDAEDEQGRQAAARARKLFEELRAARAGAGVRAADSPPQLSGSGGL